MIIADALKKAVESLKKYEIETPVVDAGVILCHVIGRDRAYLYAHGEYVLNKEEIEKYTEFIERRCNGEPVQYLIGHQEFMGLNFVVNQSVLIPRPDTEILVEAVIKYARENIAEGEWIDILDIGTGSGCIAISLAHYLKQSRVVAVDISAEALKVAEANSRCLGTGDRVEFVCSNLFQGLNKNTKHRKRFDIIVSNPPYIPSKDIPGLQVEVRGFEPSGALNGGEDGLEFYRIIASESVNFLKSNGMLAFEVGYDQAAKVEEIMMNTYFNNINVIKDLSQIERVVMGMLRKL